MPLIQTVTAIPLSFRLPPEHQVSLGIGKTIKRDAVVVRVDTDNGYTGWSEAHAARAPSAIAELINTTLASLVCGMDALDNLAVWERIYRMQLASHGMGAAAAIGLSGIDLALWDIKGKVTGKSICSLLGSASDVTPAYAGGITLGFQPAEELAEEAAGYVARGYRALKLRIGDGVENDKTRIQEVRARIGGDVEIMVDANTTYSMEMVEAVAATLDDCDIRWLEEPFPAAEYRSYQDAASVLNTPLAAGENHYTRFDFMRMLDDGAVRVWQPDLSKTGGMTEALRIAALADEHGIEIHPHTSVTALNMSATLHYLSAIPNPGYFEADLTPFNPLRDQWAPPDSIAADAAHCPPPGTGWGITLDSTSLDPFQGISGPGYV